MIKRPGKTQDLKEHEKNDRHGESEVRIDESTMLEAAINDGSFPSSQTT